MYYFQAKTGKLPYFFIIYSMIFFNVGTFKAAPTRFQVLLGPGHILIHKIKPKTNKIFTIVRKTYKFMYYYKSSLLWNFSWGKKTVFFSYMQVNLSFSPSGL